MARFPVSSDEHKALANRFFVTKSRAKKDGTAFLWPTLADWLEDIDKLAPEDFSPDTYRINYDLTKHTEYSARTISFAGSAKTRGRAVEKASKLTTVAIDEQDKRVILAAELSIRLLDYRAGTSFQEILRDSLSAAGITP